ncbi:MAG: Wzz/FepE/Etk N-terminal domain-containing protein [Acidobacteriota bacterium]|nr:Wzz/FepE/Etk N-terminal domain-containing protein [Acidobacteriota bacterium]
MKTNSQRPVVASNDLLTHINAPIEIETTEAGSNYVHLSLRYPAVVFFRYKYLILFTFLLISFCSLTVALLIPAQYESRMKILVKNIRADAVVSTGSTNGATQDFDVSESQINTEIELLTSRDMLKKVVENCGLAVSLPTMSRSESVERAVLKLEKDLFISPVRKSNIIEVAYNARSPETASSVLNQLSNLYLEKHLEAHRTPGNSEFFDKQAAQQEGKLNAAEARLAELQMKFNIVSLNEEKQITLQKNIDVRSKLKNSEAAYRDATRRIEDISNQLKGTNERVNTQRRVLPNQYSIERLTTMLAELKNRRTQLLTKFKPKDRLVKEVEQQIIDTDEALNKTRQQTVFEQSSDLNPLRQDLEKELIKARLDQITSKSQLEVLSTEVGEYQNRLRELERVTTEYKDLERQIKILERDYEAYRTKHEEALAVEALERQKVTNAQIVEPPSTPNLPTKPNRVLYIMLGIALAGFVSLGAGLAAELLRETAYTARELEVITGYPVLATIAIKNKT